MGMKGPGGPMAPMTFVPEGDPSMAGVSSGPLALEGGEGEMAEETGEGFSGDPSDFADDAGASSLSCIFTEIPSGSHYNYMLQALSRALG